MVTFVTSRVTARPDVFQGFSDLIRDSLIGSQPAFSQSIAACAFRQASLKGQGRQGDARHPHRRLDLLRVHILAPGRFSSTHAPALKTHVCDPIGSTFVTFVNTLVRGN